MNHETLPTKRLRAAIVGGGIGGLSAACSLRRRGVDVMVFEQSEALGEIGAGLTIFPNSLRQLERMGLGEALAAVGARIGDGSQYCRADGTVVGSIVTTDSSGWNGVYGMHRADLLNVLAASLSPDTIRTGHRCIGFEQSAVAARLKFANGETADADIVIAADGIHSVLQKYVVEPKSPEYSGVRAYRGFGCSRLSRFDSSGKTSRLAGGSPPSLDGGREAFHGVPGSQRPASELCRLRSHKKYDDGVVVRCRRSRRACVILRRMGSACRQAA
jgi:2-polyprenyl-6-methoxyphenol hydroxylase-like FAD-dependent oxidoreductase